MSDKKISEKGISNAAELLYKGAKMLAHHCPDCKVPLFEKDGRIFCPSCGREAVFEDSAIEKRAEKFESSESSDEGSGVGGSRETLYEKIERAISRVCDMIVEAGSPEEVKELSESIEKLALVLEKLKQK